MCTPLPLSAVIVKANGQVDLFVKPEKLNDEVRTHLGNDVSIRTEEDIADGLAALKGQSVIADPSVSSAWYFETLKAAGANVIKAQDPVALPKACKNAAEIAGTTEAHKRDAVPLIKFLHWLPLPREQSDNEKTRQRFTLPD